jgi:hypothetical protein
MLHTHKITSQSLTWSFSTPHRQTFYDPKHRLLTIKNQSTLEFLPFPSSPLNLPSSLSLKATQKEDPIEEVLSLGYSLTMRSVCYQTTAKSLIIQNLINPSKKAILNYDKLGQVLWFDWLRGSGEGNFFVVTNLAIQILEFNEEKMSFRKVSAYKGKILNVWFDGVKQLLGVNYEGEPEVVGVYDMGRLGEVSWRNPTYRVTLDLGEGSDLDGNIFFFWMGVAGFFFGVGFWVGVCRGSWDLWVR